VIGPGRARSAGSSSMGWGIMITIRCTQKLSKELGPKRTRPGASDDPGDPGDGVLGSWFANLFRLERRKCVLLTNDRTLYSVLLHGLRKADFAELGPLLVEALLANLRGDGVPAETVASIGMACHPIVWGPTNSRSVLGSQNELIQTCKLLAKVDRTAEGPDLASLQHRLNRLPLQARDNLYAVGLLREALRELDPARRWEPESAGGPAPAPAEPEGSVLQLEIVLEEVEPAVWRRIQVPAGCSFWDLHVAIQDAMGWSDTHLHAFEVEGRGGMVLEIGIPDPDGEADVIPGWKRRVADVLDRPGREVPYEYDFGDSWRHAVRLEKILPAEPGATYPRCLAGARRCPPEDCGGPPGYEDVLAVLADPAHAEHDALLEWLGGAFDPDAFSPAQVRFDDPARRLRELLS
jgi:hypothetical protein